MAVTYVSANEVGNMLSDKFHKIYHKDNVPRVRRLLNAMHNEFTEFRKEQDKFVTATLCEMDDRLLIEAARKEQEEDGFSWFNAYTDLKDMRATTNKAWNADNFNVGSVEPYNSSYLGLCLSTAGNDAIRAERSTIVNEFFKNGQGLPVHHIRSDFDPHAVFFRGHRPIEQLIIRNVENPDSIKLLQPDLVVNLKR